MRSPIRSPIPVMTHAEKQARASAKRDILLRFLASGEVYTTADIAGDLLQIDRRRAAALLASLEKQGFLKSEQHTVAGEGEGNGKQFSVSELRQMLADPAAAKAKLAEVEQSRQKKGARTRRIYGISPHGLAFVDAAGGKHFELGRTNSGWIPHRLECQRIRIASEAAGWTNWTTDRDLHLQGLKKIPDAVATDPAGVRVAIELERHAKTPKRYAEILAAHLLQVKAGHYSRIEYVSPPGDERLIRNSMQKVASVKVNGEAVKLEQKHRDRFTFHSIADWPEVRK